MSRELFQDVNVMSSLLELYDILYPNMHIIDHSLMILYSIIQLKNL